MTAPSETGVTSIFSRSQEPVTETVSSSSHRRGNLAFMPGVCPPMLDPSLFDNPELIQIQNSYELARFRTQAAGDYASSLIANFQADFAQTREAFLKSGGQLDIDGNVIQ